MLVISTYGNSTFRTEELEGIFRVIDDKTHKITKSIRLHFKSGGITIITCKTLKETKELFDNITKIMQQDYNNLIK